MDYTKITKLDSIIGRPSKTELVRLLHDAGLKSDKDIGWEHWRSVNYEISTDESSHAFFGRGDHRDVMLYHVLSLYGVRTNYDQIKRFEGWTSPTHGYRYLDMRLHRFGSKDESRTIKREDKIFKILHENNFIYDFDRDGHISIYAQFKNPKYKWPQYILPINLKPGMIFFHGGGLHEDDPYEVLSNVELMNRGFRDAWKHKIDIKIRNVRMHSFLDRDGRIGHVAIDRKSPMYLRSDLRIPSFPSIPGAGTLYASDRKVAPALVILAGVLAGAYFLLRKKV